MTIACLAALGGMALITPAHAGDGSTAPGSIGSVGASPISAGPLHPAEGVRLRVVTRSVPPSAASVGLGVLLLAARRARR